MRDCDAMRTLRWTTLLLTLAACSASEIAGTQVVFNLDADLTAEDEFWHLPWPMDLRLVDGAPDLRGFPNPSDNVAVAQLLRIADRREGFPMNTAGFFQFKAAVTPQDPERTIPGLPDSPILLVDLVDGTLSPVVASTPEEDDYVPEGFLAVAPRPGIILKPRRTYAYVVMRSLRDEKGELLGVPLAVRKLLEGQVPDGRRGKEALRLFEPLGDALKKAKVDVDGVAAAAVFTTGDVVADLYALTERVRAAYPDTRIEGLVLDEATAENPVGGNHSAFCELRGTVRLPQFQQGPPPWDEDGTFAFDSDGNLVKQREEDVPLTITLPKGTMPKGGWPLMMYFHGSGGNSREGVDAGPKDTPDGERRINEGPSSVVAPLKLATAMSALPISPERVPGAGDFAYLNLGNFSAFADLFRQGVIEQRLFLDALLKLEISQATVDGCDGMALPEGETAHRFKPDEVVALGLSMGGMYTNMVSAVEPRIRASAPTGAGGYWSYFILKTEKVPGALLIGPLLGAASVVDYLHPAIQLAQLGWEWAEPMVYTPRLGRRPLPGHPTRPVYQPVGARDSYFPEPLLDAMAVAYGNEQGGRETPWPGLQQALTEGGRGGFVDYPVTDNLVSDEGEPYTGVVVPWAFDGFNGHHVVFQLNEVKNQYGCFFTSLLKTGRATVIAPDAECPHTLGH